MRFLGVAIAYGGALVGLILTLIFVYQQWGIALSVVGLVIFPVLVALIPWVAAFGYGQWTPVLVT